MHWFFSHSRATRVMTGTGSVFLNCLAGALFGLVPAFPLVCVLTGKLPPMQTLRCRPTTKESADCVLITYVLATGASCCYGISYLFGRRLAYFLFGDKITALERTLAEQDKNANLLAYLLFARIFPASPNFLLNLASPLVGVPFRSFVVSVFLGKFFRIREESS